MTRDLGAEVRPAVDLDRVRAEWRALDEREHRTLGEIRLARGRLLVEARKAFPARGPKAKGWGELLAEWRLSQQTAYNLMSLAGYVAEREQEVSQSFCETDDESLTTDAMDRIDREVNEEFLSRPAPAIPTYREAGIIREQPRAPTPAPVAAPPDVLRDFAPPPPPPPARVHPVEVTEEQRRAVAEAERRHADDERIARAGGHIDERAEKARVALAEYAAAQSAITRLHQRGIFITDVSTSPDDFARIKRLASDLIEAVLSDLERAGEVDGKAKRAQLSLLRGGIQ